MEDAVAKPSPQREAVQKLLGEKFKVDVKDGRVFVGQFYCLDAAGSLILMDAYELESASLLDNTCGEKSSEALLMEHCIQDRFVGVVIVPRDERISCSVLSASQ